MKRASTYLLVLMLGLATAVGPALAKGSSTKTSSRMFYGGGHHTTSHGGKYIGGHGASHKGGKYANPKTSNQYGRHK